MHVQISVLYYSVTHVLLLHLCALLSYACGNSNFEIEFFIIIFFFLSKDAYFQLIQYAVLCYYVFRWAQVTEELRQALWELQEEKEKRRYLEDELNLKAYEQDGALSEEHEVTGMGEDATETLLLVADNSPSEEEDKLAGEHQNEPEKEAALPSHQKQQEPPVSSLQGMKQSADSDDNQMQTLQVYTNISVSVLTV